MTTLRTDIAVVGAGPVGMVAALSAARYGYAVVLIEKNRERPAESRAIGISPPSLGVFERLGIVAPFLEEGVRVTRAGGYSTGRRLCPVELSGIGGNYPFVMTLPQYRTEALLENEVLRQPAIRLLRGTEARGYNSQGAGCSVEAVEEGGSGITVEARFVIAGDGMRSTIRRSAGVRFHGNAYSHTFLMADYTDCTGWGDEARIYFTARGSVESFPLPGGRRRFVIRTRSFVDGNGTGTLAAELRRRCGVSVDGMEPGWLSPFGVQRFRAASFALPRVFFCGDAAHVMSPIGGQNMNVGFADAELATWMIDAVLRHGRDPSVAARVYHRFRWTAAVAAAVRAELMMRAGTSGGRLWNVLRNTATGIAFATPFATSFTGMFTMLSLPNRDLPSCRDAAERCLSR